MKLKTFSFALFATLGGIALFTIPWLIGIAHAAADPAAAVAAAGAGLSWPEWVGIGLAGLAGVKAIVDALLAFFRFLAPKTATTVDDTIRDDLQLAHDKLDALSQLVQGIAKPVAPETKTGGAS